MRASQALAVGGFYRPDKRTMLSIGASTTSSKHMMNMGISIALDRLPEAERRAKEAAKAAGVEPGNTEQGAGASGGFGAG